MIAALFVLKLSAGITLMWWLMPRKDVTDGFYRIQMRLLLGLAVLSALLFSSQAAGIPVEIQGSAPANSSANDPSMSPRIAVYVRNLAIAVAVVAYAGSVFWALGRRLPGNICIHLLNILCVGSLVLYSWNVSNLSTLPHQILSDFSSALTIGGVLTGMLLGHWYLTTPTMSINPLWWFNTAILIACFLRIAASAWSLTAFGPLDNFTQQVWLSIRWAGGIVSPIIMTALVWRILKHRNTQSATGVLFAGLILVFMGEMTATLLERATLIPY